MLNLLGEYPGTLDAKSRVLLPAALKKQLGGEASNGFVVNRDVFSQCLVLYPMEEWNRTSADVRRLIPHVSDLLSELESAHEPA